MVGRAYYAIVAALVLWSLVNPCAPVRCRVSWSMDEDLGVFNGEAK
jgi:hypothetical protein